MNRTDKIIAYAAFILPILSVVWGVIAVIALVIRSCGQ